MERHIRHARELICRQIESPKGLPEIAAQININYHTLRKQFSKSEGIPMKTYHQNQRVEAAERLLLNPQMTIYHIAGKLGFSASGNFTRWFKHYTGLTPSFYRKKQSPRAKHTSD